MRTAFFVPKYHIQPIDKSILSVILNFQPEI